MMNTKCSQIRANNVVHLQLKVLRFIFVMLKFHSTAIMNQERLLDYNRMHISFLRHCRKRHFKDAKSIAKSINEMFQANKFGTFILSRAIKIEIH